MSNDYIQEIAALWDKINELDKKLSDFIDAVHAVSTEGISENSGGLLDVAEISDENSVSIEDLDRRVTALEGK